MWPHISSSLLPLIFPVHCKEKGGVVVGDTEEGWAEQRGGGRRVRSSPSPPPTPALFSISSLSTLQKEVWSGVGQLTGATGEAEWSDGMMSERRQTSSWKMFAAWATKRGSSTLRILRGPSRPTPTPSVTPKCSTALTTAMVSPPRRGHHPSHLPSLLFSLLPTHRSAARLSCPCRSRTAPSPLSSLFSPPPLYSASADHTPHGARGAPCHPPLHPCWGCAWGQGGGGGSQQRHAARRRSEGG